MTIFYVDEDKDKNQEFTDKFDFAKFIDGRSDVPEDTKLKIKKAIGQVKE